jgi:hypothetical protein
LNGAISEIHMPSLLPVPPGLRARYEPLLFKRH